MPKLGVNIDHVATLREARKIYYPDPIRAALACQNAGADSIVCHLREDRRHIQDRDLYKLKKTIKIKLNLEMAMSTPPFGMLLFVMKGSAPKGTTLGEICLAAAPFLVCDLIVMIILIAFPNLVLFLPSLM